MRGGERTCPDPYAQYAGVCICIYINIGRTVPGTDKRAPPNITTAQRIPRAVHYVVAGGRLRGREVRI